MKKNGRKIIPKRANDELILVFTLLLLITIVRIGLNFFPEDQSRAGSEKFAEAIRDDQDYLLDLSKIKNAGQVSGFCPDWPVQEIDLLKISGAKCHLSPRGASSGVRLASGKKILLNQAGARELELVPGIGPKRAEEILCLRQELDGFENLEELKRFRWINEKMIQQFQTYFTIRDEG